MIDPKNRRAIGKPIKVFRPSILNQLAGYILCGLLLIGGFALARVVFNGITENAWVLPV